MSAAVALAHPNIALSKYWGKRAGAGNFPAVPSLSVTLAAMSTRTRVSFDDDLASDRLVLDGVEAEGEPLSRARRMIKIHRSSNFSHIQIYCATCDTIDIYWNDTTIYF